MLSSLYRFVRIAKLLSCFACSSLVLGVLTLTFVVLFERVASIEWWISEVVVSSHVHKLGMVFREECWLAAVWCWWWARWVKMWLILSLVSRRSSQEDVGWSKMWCWWSIPWAIMWFWCWAWWVLDNRLEFESVGRYQVRLGPCTIALIILFCVEFVIARSSIGGSSACRSKLHHAF